MSYIDEMPIVELTMDGLHRKISKVEDEEIRQMVNYLLTWVGILLDINSRNKEASEEFIKETIRVAIKWIYAK